MSEKQTIKLTSFDVIKPSDPNIVEASVKLAGKSRLTLTCSYIALAGLKSHPIARSIHYDGLVTPFTIEPVGIAAWPLDLKTILPDVSPSPDGQLTIRIAHTARDMMRMFLSISIEIEPA